MRHRLLFASALLVGLPLGLSAAHAQAPGSYARSCRNISQDGFTLSAVCQAPGGRRVQTSIDLRQCRGQPVSNNFGRLTCGNVQGSGDDVGGGGGDGRGFGGGGGFAGGGYRNDDGGYQGGGFPRPRYGYGDADDAPPPPPPPPRRRYVPLPDDDE